MERDCKLDCISRPDGSVLYSEGETVVIAGIYGPVEAKASKILADRGTVEAHFRPKTGIPGVGDRLYESVIRSVCESVFSLSLFPRSSIVVVIQEMQNSGQLISCSLNAACLAALSSGIDMKFMFAAVTCFLDHKNAFKLIQPVNKEEVNATFVFVFDSVAKNVVTTYTQGSFSKEQYQSAVNLCREQSESIFDYFKSSLNIK